MDTGNEYVDPVVFETFLAGARGERSLLNFVTEHPRLLYWALCRTSGHCRYLLAEFHLGNLFVADFVVLNAYSGVWEVKLVEFEPVDTPLFTKKGIQARRLAGAIKQVDDWATYVEANLAQVRSDLVRRVKQKDVLHYSDPDRQSNYTGQRLGDPQTYLKFSYHVFMSRRVLASADDLARKARMEDRRRVEVVTYDRLLDVARDRSGNVDVWGDRVGESQLGGRTDV